MTDRSVTIRLRIASAEFDAGMAKAGTEVKILAKVVDDAGKKAGGAAPGMDKLAKSASNASDKVGLIGPSAAAGFALLGPAVGAATAGVVGFAGAAGVAVLAAKGIQREIAASTVQGRAFTAQTSALGVSLGKLETIAAHGALPGVTAGLAKVNAALPATSGSVAQLSTDLGLAADHLGGALANGLKNSGPIFRSFGAVVDQGAASLERFTDSADFKRFVAYSAQELPRIANLLGQAAVAGKNLAVALQPLGDFSLGNLSAGLSTFNQLSNTAQSLNTGIGKAPGGGVINTLLQPGGELKLGVQFGNKIGLDRLPGIGALWGSGGGNKQTKQQKQAAIDAQNALDGQAKSLGTTTDLLQAAKDANDKNADAIKNSAEQQRLQNLLLAQSNPTLANQAAALGTTALSYQAAQQAVDGSRLAFVANTQQMQLANNVLGLLNQSFDTFSGKALGVSEAQTALGQATLATVDAIKQNGDTVADNTTKGLANRQAIEANIDALRAKAQADAAAGKSQQQVNVNYISGRKALLDQIEQIYGANSAVYTYAQSLSKLPPQVSTAVKLNITGVASLDALAVKLNTLDGKAVSTYINTYYKDFVDNRPTQNPDGTYSTPPHAKGGGVADGWFTVGEEGGSRGWELGHKQGSNVQLFSNAQSRRMTGWDHVPGYASGTVKTSNVVATSGDITGTIQAVSQATPGLAAAVRRLSQAVAAAFTLEGVNAKVAAATKRLDDLRTSRNQVLTSTQSSVLGKFDPLTAGADIFGQAGSLSDVIGGFQSNAVADKKFAQQIVRLRGLGLNSTLLGQYASNGPSDIVSTLAGASKSQIAAINSAYSSANNSAGIVGTAVANAQYGAQIAQAAATTAHLTAVNAALATEVRRLTAAITAGTGRNTVIKQVSDSKVISQAIARSV
jgi:hypothetical protein